MCQALPISHFPYFSWEIMPQPISSRGEEVFPVIQTKYALSLFHPITLSYILFYCTCFVSPLSNYSILEIVHCYIFLLDLFLNSTYSLMLNPPFSFIFLCKFFFFVIFFQNFSFLHKYLVMKCPERNLPPQPVTRATLKEAIMSPSSPSMCLLKKSINLSKLFNFLHALLPLQSGASLLFSITSLIDRLFFRVPVSLLSHVLLKTSIYCKK